MPRPVRTATPVAETSGPPRLELITRLTKLSTFARFVGSVNCFVVLNCAIIALIAIASGNGIHAPRAVLRKGAFIYVSSLDLDILELTKRTANQRAAASKFQNVLRKAIFVHRATVVWAKTVLVTTTVVTP